MKVKTVAAILFLAWPVAAGDLLGVYTASTIPACPGGATQGDLAWVTNADAPGTDPAVWSCDATGPDADSILCACDAVNTQWIALKRGQAVEGVPAPAPVLDSHEIGYQPSTPGDWPDPDPERVEEALDAIASGGIGGGSITVETADQGTQVSGVDTLQLDQAVGITLADQGGGVGLVSLSAVPVTTLGSSTYADLSSIVSDAVLGKTYHLFDDAGDFEAATSGNAYAALLFGQTYTHSLTPPDQSFSMVLNRHLFAGSTQSEAGAKTNDGVFRSEFYKGARSQTGGAHFFSLHANAGGDAILLAHNLYSLAPSDRAGDEAAALKREVVSDSPERDVTGTWDADVTATDPSAVGTVSLATRQRYLSGEGGYLYYKNAAHQIAVTVTDFDPTRKSWTVSEDISAIATGKWCFALDDSVYSSYPAGTGSFLDMLPVTGKPGEALCGTNRDQTCGANEFATQWLFQSNDRAAPPRGYSLDRNGNGIINETDYDFSSPTGILAKCEEIASVNYSVDPDTMLPTAGDAAVTITFQGGAQNSITQATSAWSTSSGGPPGRVWVQTVDLHRERGQESNSLGGGVQFRSTGSRALNQVWDIQSDGTQNVGHGFRRILHIGIDALGPDGVIDLESDAGGWFSPFQFDVDNTEYGSGTSYPLASFEGSGVLGWHSSGWLESGGSRVPVQASSSQLTGTELVCTDANGDLQSGSACASATWNGQSQIANPVTRQSFTGFGVNSAAPNTNCMRPNGGSQVSCDQLYLSALPFSYPAAPTAVRIYCSIDAGDITDADIDTLDIDFRYVVEGEDPILLGTSLGTITLLDAAPADANLHVISSTISQTLSSNEGVFIVKPPSSEVDADADSSWNATCGIDVLVPVEAS